MKTLRHAVIFTPIFLLLAGCASTPDPAEICTAEWIQPRAAKAVGKIEKRGKASIKTLAKTSETFAQGKTPGPFQMFALGNALNKMKKELTNGQGIRDLRTVAKTCNDPNIIKDSMHTMLERQGVSPALLTWMENNPIYESLISSMTAPTPITRNR